MIYLCVLLYFNKTNKLFSEILQRYCIIHMLRIVFSAKGYTYGWDCSRSLCSS